MCSAIFAMLFSGASLAGTLDLQLVDPRGAPAVSLVVMAVPESAPDSTLSAVDPELARESASMDQVNERFVPELLVVRKGTLVAFPNSDQVRHHVYSFSEAKRFELPLYKGNQHDPVPFDREGLVVLGCNIHDHMVGYILVVDTPYYAISDDQGQLQLSDLPDGAYQLTAWHPGMEVPEAAVARVLMQGADSSLRIEVASGWHSSRNLAMRWDDY